MNYDCFFFFTFYGYRVGRSNRTVPNQVNVIRTVCIKSNISIWPSHHLSHYHFAMCRNYSFSHGTLSTLHRMLKTQNVIWNGNFSVRGSDANVGKKEFVQMLENVQPKKLAKPYPQNIKFRFSGRRHYCCCIEPFRPDPSGCIAKI